MQVRMRWVWQVMGGECNYLHRVTVGKHGRLGLEVVPPDLWKDGRGVRWSHEDIKVLLDTAEVRRFLVDAARVRRMVRCTAR